MTGVSRALALVLAALIVPSSAVAFVQETGGTGNAHWATTPVSFSLNTRGTVDVPGTQEFTAVRSAFSAWDATASSGLSFTEGPLVATGADDTDFTNVVVWIEDASDPLVVARDLIASTLTNFLGSGEIFDADVTFDAVHFSWTVAADGRATSNSGAYDVQEIVTHEIGHLLGLDHVTTRTSVMFPSTYPGGISRRTLQQDEVSAAQFIYPPGGPPSEARISGTVTRSGVGVKRAYVVAYQAGQAVVGSLADAAGNYSIRRVPPGSYLVRVQPYSKSVQVVASPFYRDTGGQNNVDVDFLSLIYPNSTQESAATTVAAIAGTNTTGINFAVSASGSLDDPFEQDDTFGTAKPITINGSAHLKHSSPSADQDWVTFTATANRLYIIDSRNLGPEVVTVSPDDASSMVALELYNQTGIAPPLASNQVRNRLEARPEARIAWYDAVGGVRYVKAVQRRSATAGAGAFYDLAVTELTGPFAPPSIATVNPTSGTQVGGTVLSVSGFNFLPGAQVTFGGTPGTEPDVQNCVTPTDCRIIRVIVPAHAVGAATVQVTNPDSQSGSLAAGFTYNATASGAFIEGSTFAFGEIIGDGSVACWGDFDSDGDPDLFAPYHGASPSSNRGELWRNNGDATFTDVTGSAGMDVLGGFKASCAWGDFDDDGDLDLLVVPSGGGAGSANRLYRNNGNGTFTNVAGTALIGGNTSVGRADAAWGDYDLDGDLDLYLVYGNAGATNQLFQNNGDSTFTDVSVAASVNAPGAVGAAAWGDYDADGRPDLYVVRASGQPDILYHNNGNGTFSNITTPAGIVEAGNCAAVAWADFNNDRQLDLLCVGDSLVGSQPQRFWINQGNGTFTDQAVAAGLNSLGRHATTLTILDRDNDGDRDAYVGCTQGVGGQLSDSLDLLLDNNGASIPVFTNVACPLNVNCPSGVYEHGFERQAFASAAADFDQNGFADVLVVGAGSGFSDDDYFWDSFRSNTNESLTIRLRGTVSNSWSLGAEVTVISDVPGLVPPPDAAQCLTAMNGAGAQRQQVLGGSHGQDSIELEFGLGERPPELNWVDCVIVRWPRSGLRRVFTQVATASRLDVTEDPGVTGPVVTRVSPSSGTTAGGTTVTVFGFNFSTPPQAPAEVRFNGALATVVPGATENVITVTTPPGVAGLATVEVRNPGPPIETGTLNGFTYISPSTRIVLSLAKDAANNAVDLTWTGIGQDRYRVRRATGSTPAAFSAGFQTVSAQTQYQDTNALNNGVNYFYLVDEGEP